MKRDQRRAFEERELLVQRAAAALCNDMTAEDAKTIAERLVSAFAKVQGPEEPQQTTKWINMREGGMGSATSLSPGNVALSFRTLVAAFGATAVGLASLPVAPWAMWVSALLIFNELWSKAEVEIDENKASILWAMWIHRDESNNTAPKTALLERVNSERSRYERRPLSGMELDDGLQALQQLRCIAPASNNPGAWWLREWIKVDFR